MRSSQWIAVDEVLDNNRCERRRWLLVQAVRKHEKSISKSISG
jgi:hypothetical protein